MVTANQCTFHLRRDDCFHTDRMHSVSSCNGNMLTIRSEPLPALEGPLSPNTKLDDGTETIFEFINGAESIFKVENFLYAATPKGIFRVRIPLPYFDVESKNVTASWIHTWYRSAA